MQQTNRLSLFHYDVVRELCAPCGKEKFQFVPIGSNADASSCECGKGREIVDLSETSVRRLVTNGSELSVRKT